MNVGDQLITISRALADAGVESARLDALILLEDVTGASRAHLLAHPEQPISEQQRASLQSAVSQRVNHVPLAYIRGKVAFYGRTFSVTEQVLVPRPETEALIELTLAASRTIATPVIADIGTGSGCIAITCALEVPLADVFAYDVDAAALAVAKHNATTLRASVRFAQQDLFQGDKKRYDIIVANLPYVPIGLAINQAASHEPETALYSGPDGLDLYRTFWRQLAERSEPPSTVITESLTSQHAALVKLAAGAGYRLLATKGLIQHFAR